MLMKTSILAVAAATIAGLVVGCGGSSGGASTGSGGSTESATNAGRPSTAESEGDRGGGNSGEGASGVSGSSLSKAEYVKQANAICARDRKQRTEEITAYTKKKNGQSEKERLSGMVHDVYIPAMESHLANLRALGAPEGEEAQVEAILQAEEEWLDAIRGLESLAASPAINKKIARAGELAKKFGLEECLVS